VVPDNPAARELFAGNEAMALDAATSRFELGDDGLGQPGGRR
jgi:hypothetical protein